MQPFDRTFDRQLGAALRDIFHDAIAPPSTVNGHHLRRMAPLKYNPMALSLLCHEPRCRDMKESNDWKTRRQCPTGGSLRITLATSVAGQSAIVQTITAAG